MTKNIRETISRMPMEAFETGLQECGLDFLKPSVESSYVTCLKKSERTGYNMRIFNECWMRFKPGDEVWWFDPYGRLQHGELYRIMEEVRNDKIYPIALITKDKSIFRGGIKTGTELFNCWPSKESCLEARQRGLEEEKMKHKEQIKDVSSLIKFLFSHDLCSEHRDEAARMAAKERVKELLNIDVE